jgi:hypothetical protein
MAEISLLGLSQCFGKSNSFCVTIAILITYHIIQESAANGSILGTKEFLLHHDRSVADEEDLHLQLCYVAPLFK